MTLRPWRYEKPRFGTFGTIDQVGDRLVCHICGRDFLSLEKHVTQTHGMPASDYKAAFGLNRTHALWSDSLRRRQSEKQTARGLGDIGRAVIERRTPDQRRHNALRASQGRGELRYEERLRLTALARANSKKGNEAAKAAGVLDWRARQTHCKRGHPFDDKNTARVNSANPNWRSCRVCARDRMREYRATKRAS